MPSYPFLFPLSDADADSFINMYAAVNTNANTALPSPPDTASDPGLDFDLESSFTHTSPDTSLLLDDPFSWDFTAMQPSAPCTVNLGVPAAAVSPVYSAPTPSSTTLISPKSSISSFADLGAGGALAFNPVPIVQTSSADTAEALSNHHLQRYLHYKALAAQAEADARAAAAFQSQQDFEAFLSNYSLPFDNTAVPVAPAPMGDAKPDVKHQLMFAPDATQYLACNNPQYQATMAHAQAEAHLHAHDLAAAQAQQQRNQTSFWVENTANAAATFGMLAQPQPQQQLPQQTWSRASISSQSASAQSPSFPLTPSSLPASLAPTTAVASLPMPLPLPISIPSAPAAVSFPSAPLVAVPAAATSPDGEDEIDEHDHDEDQDHPSTSSSDRVIPNLHGGGRGYIPGQTPDDPKKRHKCSICGRAFARAFNLKVSLLFSLLPT